MKNTVDVQYHFIDDRCKWHIGTLVDSGAIKI